MKNFFRNNPMAGMCVAMIVAAVATNSRLRSAPSILSSVPFCSPTSVAGTSGR